MIGPPLSPGMIMFNFQIQPNTKIWEIISVNSKKIEILNLDEKVERNFGIWTECWSKAVNNQRRDKTIECKLII